MTSSQPGPRPRVVIVGGGFAGHSAARSLAKRIGDAAEIVLINPTDYFLYLPLLPEVAAGGAAPGSGCPRTASPASCRSPGSPSTHTASAASRRGSTCATPSPAR